MHITAGTKAMTASEPGRFHRSRKCSLHRNANQRVSYPIIKMEIPFPYNNIPVILQYLFDFSDISCFNRPLFTKDKSIFDHIKHCIAIIPFHMYMNRLMLPTIKEKGISKKSKELRHTSQIFLKAKIGIIFNTTINILNHRPIRT